MPFFLSFFLLPFLPGPQAPFQKELLFLKSTLGLPGPVPMSPAPDLPPGTRGPADWAGRTLGFGASDPDLASLPGPAPLRGCVTSGGLPFSNGEKDSGAEVTWSGLRALLPETPSRGCGVEGGQHLLALSFLGAEITPPVLCSSPESPGPERGVQ